MATSFKNTYNGLAVKYSDAVIFPKFGIPAYLAASAPLAMLYFYMDQRKAPWQYSKFTNNSNKDETTDTSIKVSGTTFYYICYAPSFIAALAALKYFKSKNPNMDTTTPQYKHLIAPCVMMIIHFGKRLLEAKYVHITSNNSKLSMALQIAGIYASNSLIASYYQLFQGDINNYIGCEKSFKIGAILYTIGQIGNLYHHWLLKVNRLKNKTDTKYVIPQGGLFSLIWTPHYFFEIISWLGMAVTSRHLSYWSLMPINIGYLSGRAVTTKEWYQKKLGAECPERKAIFPFVL